MMVNPLNQISDLKSLSGEVQVTERPAFLDKIDQLFPSNNLQPNVEELVNKKTDFRELLMVQVKLSSYHLRVEMLTKVADSATGLFRRLQSQ